MTATTANPILYEPLPATDHLDRVLYLFGHPIAHSLSPLMHGTVYNGLQLNWAQHLFQSRDVPYFISVVRADPKFRGSAVTMPNKLAIMPFLDEVTDEARAVGACNTIYLREDQGPTGDARSRKFVGTNTDVAGIRESFYQDVPGGRALFKNRPALVVGGGGAARSAVYALYAHMGCSPIYIANRDTAEVDAVISHCRTHGYGDSLVHLSSAAQVHALPAAAAIVACIPDFEPVTEAEWETRRILEAVLDREIPGMPNEKGVILEMAYHPHPITTVAKISAAKGWQVILGTEAMVYQGLEQDSLWTGKSLAELPVEQVKKVIAERLAVHVPATVKLRVP